MFTKRQTSTEVFMFVHINKESLRLVCTDDIETYLFLCTVCFHFYQNISVIAKKEFFPNPFCAKRRFFSVSPYLAFCFSSWWTICFQLLFYSSSPLSSWAHTDCTWTLATTFWVVLCGGQFYILLSPPFELPCIFPHGIPRCIFRPLDYHLLSRGEGIANMHICWVSAFYA